MSLQNLKKELESLLNITNWSPSDEQLGLIANRLRRLRGRPTKADVESIVLEVVGTYQCFFLEGVDNSDLTTLLLLATKSEFNNDK